MAETPERQLQQLEEEYRRRRTELEQGTERSESAPSEQETMSQVLEGAIKQHVPAFQAPVPAASSDDGMLTPEEQATVQQWVTLVFTNGLDDGIKAARGSGDPALIDAFHAALTGELHGQLVQRGKLEAI